MNRNRSDILVFVGHFASHVLFVRHVIVGLVLLIVVGGVSISHVEGLQVGESIYFAFITGLTIGYGDIEPVTTGGRVLSVLIGFIGMLFTGMTVAIATRALADTAKQIRHQRS